MNKPLDTRYTICFGDDPDEIVTVVEAPRASRPPLVRAGAQRTAAALASLAMTSVLLGGVLLGMTSMGDRATPPGGAAVIAQAA